MNAVSATVSRLSGSTTSLKESHVLNAPHPMLFTPSGMTTRLITRLERNASRSMETVPFCTITSAVLLAAADFTRCSPSSICAYSTLSTAEYTGFAPATVSTSSAFAPGNRSAPPEVSPAPTCARVMPVRFLNAFDPTSATESGRTIAVIAPSYVAVSLSLSEAVAASYPESPPLEEELPSSSEKASAPIFVSLFRSQRKFTVESDTHFENARCGTSTAPPMLTYVSDEQPMNACSPMASKPSGSTTEVNAAPAKPFLPIDASPFGMFTFDTCAPLKALAAMSLTVSGTVYTPPAVFFAAGNATSCVLSLLNSTPSATE